MNERLAARFALAMALEVVYFVVRNQIVEHWEFGVTQEFFWSAWRVPFVIAYLVLLPPFVFSGEKRRGMPWHPLLLIAFTLTLADTLILPEREDFMHQLVLAVTTPIVGVREELVYRGILQNYLERVVGPVPAIVLAAIVFTAYHYGAQPLDVVTCTGIAASGVVLGVIYQRTRNLWLVAGLHAFIDVIYAFPLPFRIEWGAAFLCNLLAFIWALAWWRVDADKARA